MRANRRAEAGQWCVVISGQVPDVSGDVVVGVGVEASGEGGVEGAAEFGGGRTGQEEAEDGGGDGGGFIGAAGGPEVVVGPREVDAMTMDGAVVVDHLSGEAPA